MIHSTMAYMNCCICLAGYHFDDINVMNYDEINDIAKKTHDVFVIWQTFMCQMNDFFWMRDYGSLVELSDKHSEKHPSTQQKRILDLFRTFYVGISSMALARDTMRVKWRRLGEQSMVKMSQYRKHLPTANIDNKFNLVKAEYHYLDNDLKSAEVAYKASIKSACKYKFVNEEALALELYGIFCIENHKSTKGLGLLSNSLEKYKQWGATKKVDQLRLFIDLIVEGNCPWHKNTVPHMKWGNKVQAP